MMLHWRLLCTVVAFLLLQGCASLRGPDPSDPLEPVNRKVTAFNDLADEERVDALSGVAVLNGVPVTVERAGPGPTGRGEDQGRPLSP